MTTVNLKSGLLAALALAFASPASGQSLTCETRGDIPD
jgi:hypothetical protein